MMRKSPKTCISGPGKKKYSANLLWGNVEYKVLQGIPRKEKLLFSGKLEEDFVEGMTFEP